MLPQEGVGIRMPSPKKLRLASEIMALPMLSVAYTTTSETVLGRMWENIIRSGDAPRIRSALQNSSFFVTMTLLRTTRANRGTLPMPMARMTLNTPEPRIVTSRMDSRIKGKANMPSIIRMITASTTPPA